LATFEEWFYFSRKDENVIKEISQHSCFALALKSMTHSACALNARECITAIIKAVKNPEDHPEIFEAIFNHVLSYIPE